MEEIYEAMNEELAELLKIASGRTRRSPDDYWAILVRIDFVAALWRKLGREDCLAELCKRIESMASVEGFNFAFSRSSPLDKERYVNLIMDAKRIAKGERMAKARRFGLPKRKPAKTAPETKPKYTTDTAAKRFGRERLALAARKVDWMIDWMNEGHPAEVLLANQIVHLLHYALLACGSELAQKLGEVWRENACRRSWYCPSCGDKLEDGGDCPKCEKEMGDWLEAHTPEDLKEKTDEREEAAGAGTPGPERAAGHGGTDDHDDRGADREGPPEEGEGAGRDRPTTPQEG
jgi:hypothetical protein